ncbi:hypothetical protein [Pseudoduganella albidiflava]|uniref:Lipoprotein n=2 Tax=Pseudoduganella albidiflava TaxID=321983 RepID=A0ABX5RYI6_9BURK|nr:hypothetical protein [Pseudoduganella albidiflava]QBI02843.1 hypothetical protein EYF70_19825 [Pseudoduganella albidiflava]
MMSSGCYLGTLLALVLATGCSGAVRDERAVALSHVEIHASGADQGGEFCKDFRLTPRQVEDFFGRARTLPPQQLHDAFDSLPCWVRGAARSPRGQVEWEIRAGNTARMTFPDGSVQLFGCDTCDALLMKK